MSIKNKYKKKVFIASSKEVKNDGLIEPILKVLSENGFEPHPWYEEFPTGEIILERLLDIAKEMDFAIFFFNADVKFTWRNEELFGTAWNVVLEYGIFLQRLSRERVRIIQCGQSHIPTDLSGLIVTKIEATEMDKIKEKIEEKSKDIAKHWKNIPSLNDDNLGISKSIIEHKNDLEDILEIIAKHQKTNGIRKPLVFDEKLIVNFYLNGLNNVEKRFWTTTYLSSGFWVHKTDGVIPANENMLSRLSKSRFKDVKRLFIIRREFEEELEVLRKKLTDYKNRKGGGDKLIEAKFQFRNLYESCKSLKAKGCDIRFVPDNIYAETFLNNYIRKDDTEIAIYDDYRVDFFGGGKKSKITEVKIFTNIHRDFKEIKLNSEKYFNHLWNESRDIDILLEQFEDVFINFDKKVDYTLKKLLIFDNDIEERDTFLKQEEMQQVKKYLIQNGISKTISTYLDIGTCTGRYPFELKEIINVNSTIYGYDSDPDCIDYLKLKKKIKKKEGNNVENIIFSQANFLYAHDKILDESRHFDLITCMLGTISHFGSSIDSSENFHDSLQLSLKKMASLLTENGILILSNWTQSGIDNGMLSIYNHNDIKILKSGTESGQKLKKRLEMLSLKIEDIRTVGHEKELDIYFCKKCI